MFNGQIKGGTDLLLGLLMAALSSLFLFLLGDLDVGSEASMGPGYFPRALIYLILILSALLILRSLFIPGEWPQRLALKPLAFVVAGLVAFALIIDRAGLLIATVVLVVISAFGSSERYFWQSVAFGFALAVACCVIFIWALGVPMKVFPWA